MDKVSDKKINKFPINKISLSSLFLSPCPGSDAAKGDCRNPYRPPSHPFLLDPFRVSYFIRRQVMVKS
ncbi:hypothetical protein RIF29_25350 [Crotalaria pallida]|uniref:Uncharacterized protein n=1 Tax=Crotalaria pallida TaxID=3830 RepID=A0AAN9EM02_CROPI